MKKIIVAVVVSVVVLLSPCNLFANEISSSVLFLNLFEFCGYIVGQEIDLYNIKPDFEFYSKNDPNFKDRFKNLEKLQKWLEMKRLKDESIFVSPVKQFRKFNYCAIQITGSLKSFVTNISILAQFRNKSEANDEWKLLTKALVDSENIPMTESVSGDGFSMSCAIVGKNYTIGIFIGDEDLKKYIIKNANNPTVMEALSKKQADHIDKVSNMLKKHLSDSEGNSK